eukprot:41048_1
MSVPSSNPSADANSDAITSTVCCKLCLIKGLSFEACRRSKNNFSRHLNTEHNKKPVKRKKFYYVFKSDGTPNIPPMELFANHALKTGYAKGKKAHEDAKNGGDDKKAKKQWKSELCLSETTKHLNKIKDNDVDGKKDNNNQHTQQIVHHALMMRALLLHCHGKGSQWHLHWRRKKTMSLTRITTLKEDDSIILIQIIRIQMHD